MQIMTAQYFACLGVVSTIAGKPITKPNMPGSGDDNILLNGPTDVLLRRRPCSLLVSDLGNHRLLSISLPASSCVSSNDGDGWLLFDYLASTAYVHTTFSFDLSLICLRSVRTNSEICDALLLRQCETVSVTLAHEPLPLEAF